MPIREGILYNTIQYSRLYKYLVYDQFKLHQNSDVVYMNLALRRLKAETALKMC